jgi:hypothetical protein
MFREEVLFPILFRHNGGSIQQRKEFGYNMLLLTFIYLFTYLFVTYNGAWGDVVVKALRY